MGLLEKFIDLITIDSPSDPTSPTCPSTAVQLNVADHVEKQMKELGVSRVRQQDGYVYGEIPATPGYEDKKAVGFIAHMDTAPEFNGFGVKPQIIRDYDGGDVLLAGSGHVLSPGDYPVLKTLAGRTLITTDGTTLLGADDKAGIAEILQAAEEILASGLPHGKICLGFTPDEEIGRGPLKFDVPDFGADFAYTLDGGEPEGITYENFNADAAVVTFTGYSIHPGSAKDKMKNSQNIAMEFHAMLPAAQRPEYTDGYEGFIHLTDSKGSTERTVYQYIIRDHDREKLLEKGELMRRAAAFLNGKYGEGSVQVEITETYRNMKEKILLVPEVSALAEQAIRAVGLEPTSQPVRGGTDGATLSYMGLPCPNLGTGGMNAHGRYECCTLEGMEQCVNIVLEIVKGVAAQA